MKCQDFETTIYSLAREQSVEASARSRALKHIEQCRRCADALAEQRAVASRVRAVAASLVNAGASTHVEATLRRAFRQQTLYGNAPTIGPRPARQLWRRWELAAVAAIILLTFLMGVRWLKSPAADWKQNAWRPSPTPAASAPVTAGGRDGPLAPNGKANAQEKKLAAHRKARRTVDRDASPETEVATSFYPLFEEGELVPLESGRVVRVEIPASTLISLGLPITAENSDRPLQADLLLGQDGMARAIRFLP